VSYKYAGFNVEYLGEFDKGADFDGREIDDVNTFNISFSWYPGFATEIKVEVEDLLDNKYEFIPDYNSGGRRLKLSFNTIL
jgi:outer membrane cobalamin receptor